MTSLNFLTFEIENKEKKHKNENSDQSEVQKVMSFAYNREQTNLQWNLEIDYMKKDMNKKCKFMHTYASCGIYMSHAYKLHLIAYWNYWKIIL